MSAVSVRGLRKSYGGVEAVRGIDFEIQPGEVFGLLGPNGAGKTTTIEILEGYRDRSGGRGRGARRSIPQQAGSAWREQLGIVLQSSSLYPNLTVRESVANFAGYYERPRDADEVVALVGLAEKADARVRDALGWPEAPARPRARPDRRSRADLPRRADDRLRPRRAARAWETIRNLRSLGKTILLTTHYLDEAEQLADRVAVLRAGEIVREGKPSELTGASPQTEIRFRRNGETVLERTEEPTQRLHELIHEARRRRDRRARGPPPDARGRLPGADRMRLWIHELRTEQLLFWRNREAAFFTFFLPVIFFLIFGSVYGKDLIKRSTSRARRSSRRG